MGNDKQSYFSTPGRKSTIVDVWIDLDSTASLYIHYFRQKHLIDWDFSQYIFQTHKQMDWTT